ncbi:MAG: prepilin-type N-terminal cleavage/methylation domain-containing protein, partial [Candidatus Omnitrophota bacterium]
MTQKIKFSHKSGMTLTEVLMSLALGAIIIGIVMGMWYFAYKNWNIEIVKTKLRVQLEIAMEQIKKELRLSSATYISLYKPPASSVYEAISFPQATRDANNFLVLSGGNIFWDTSIIYHTYEDPISGNTQFRKTIFTDNNSVITNTAQREAQLVSVVADGDGSGAINGGNATTKIIFENLIDFTMEPKAQYFDGYSPVAQRSDNVEFGTVKLDPGDHDITFQVIGANTASTGFEMGIDTMSIAPSGCVREAEAYVPVASSGDGTTKVSAVGWGGNNYLEYNADGVGDYATFRLYYDAWVESNFDNFVLENMVTPEADPSLRLAAPKESGDAECWTAGDQTDPGGDGSITLPDANLSIRNILSSSKIERSGSLVRIKFTAHSANPLTINTATIMESASPGGDDGTGVVMQLFFSDPAIPAGEEEPESGGTKIGNDGGAAPSFVSIPAGNFVWSNWAEFSMDETKEYLVSFSTPIANVAYWTPTDVIGITNSFYSLMVDDLPSSLIWGSSTASPSTYAVEAAENWLPVGTATSIAYDTKMENPNYGQIAWTSYKPSGTDIALKVRSSDNSSMAGATDWSALAGLSSSPSPISIGTGRYVQFQATLTTSAPYTAFPWID